MPIFLDFFLIKRICISRQGKHTTTKASFVLAWNGPECGLFRPDQFGPIRSQVRLEMAVRLDMVWNESLFSPFYGRNGNGPSYVWNRNGPGLSEPAGTT
jgi:hypothetical protein